MVFWVGILVGATVAWAAAKFGLRDAWLFLFNSVLAVFLAIFLTEPIIEGVPSAGETSYGTALTLLATGIGSLLLLQGTAYAFVTSQFKVPFPRILDKVAAACLGFAAGFLIWSFLSLVVSLTPAVNNQMAEESGFRSQTQQAAIPYIGFWCDIPHGIVGSPGGPASTHKAIEQLFELAARKSGRASESQASDDLSTGGENVDATH